jgi:DNA-binding NarL/FixJ family response regulator
MNRSTESPGVAGLHRSAPHNAVSILLVGREDRQLDQVVKLLSARDNFRVVARVDPQDDWYARLPAQVADIVLLQQSLIAPSNPFDHAPLAESVFSSLPLRFPDLRIVVFGTDLNDVFVRRMLRLGVHGLVDISSNGELLAAAIDEVHRGGYWVARKALEKLVHSAIEIERIIERGFVDQISAMQDGLTRREAEVLERVLDGMSNKEIAGQLFLSEQGVKMHLGRLFRKFGVANRAQLILIAFRRVCPFNHNLVDYLRQAREERGPLRH